MKGDGVLCGGGEAWAEFLSRVGSDPSGEDTFTARNFLLDEGIVPQRFESYQRAGAMADHGRVETWKKAHEAYLAHQVFSRPTGYGLPKTVDPTDEDACPETFRFIDLSSPFLSSHSAVTLLRVVDLEWVARDGHSEAETVKALAEQVVRSGDPKASERLDDVLATWAHRIDSRPVFAAFLRDVEDLFGAKPEDDSPDWADDLRDRLGLAHFDPGAYLKPLDVLVFGYPVSTVPALKNFPKISKPLVPPTVLDGRFSQAFLPTPRGSLTGHVLDLSGGAPAPRREVLHPSIPFQAKHLFRVGTIARPVNLNNFPVARGLHIWLVRQMSGRADYAQGTDGDIL